MSSASLQRAALAALAAAALSCALPIFAEPSAEGPSPGDPDYVAGLQAIEGEDWQAAIKLLSSAALRDARNPDIQNHLGYAYRRGGEVALSFQHYARALQIDPRHRGAHEYLGEAYLMIGNLPKAEEHLAELKRICLIPCAEYGVLAARIADYRTRQRQ